MKKKRLMLAVVALAVVTGSVAAYFQATAKGEVPQFTTAEVLRGDVVETVDATGTLQAVTTVQVGTQVSGTIQSLNADFNSEVKKGQVVARLDPSLLQAQVDQAEATVTRLKADVDRAKVALTDAQLKLKRAQDLSKAQLLPANDLETAESTARQAEAAVKSAEAQVTQAVGSLNQNRVNLDHSIITAPVDGVVISRNVDVGQTVAASMQAPTLFVIAKDLNRMQVNASIDEADIGKIAPGQNVSFHVDAYPNETFKGTVSQVRLEPVVTQNVVSYVTVISVPNDELKLKPGMTANVTVEIARADNVLRVPNAALRFRPAADGTQTANAERRQAGGGANGGGFAGRGNGANGGGGNGGRGANGNGAGRAAGQGGNGAAAANGQPRERGGRVFVNENGQLRPVRVQTGISDGTTTAIVGGDLAENTQVVTGVAIQSAGAAQPSTSPLLPFGRGRGGNNNRGGGGAAPAAPRPGAGR